MARISCRHCGRVADGPIIHDSLWESICDRRKDLMCYKCMESRLGRDIELKDLKPCPVNNFLIVALCRESLARREGRVMTLGDKEIIIDGLKAAIRAANLAIFVIRKQGVMPNSSWEAGLKSDIKHAEGVLKELRQIRQEGDFIGRSGIMAIENPIGHPQDDGGSNIICWFAWRLNQRNQWIPSIYFLLEPKAVKGKCVVHRVTDPNIPLSLPSLAHRFPAPPIENIED